MVAFSLPRVDLTQRVMAFEASNAVIVLSGECQLRCTTNVVLVRQTLDIVSR